MSAADAPGRRPGWRVRGRGWAAAAALLLSTATAQANALQAMHQQALRLAQAEAAAARSDEQRAAARLLQAAALNSLRQSAEALALLEQAPEAERRQPAFIDTQAKVLLALGRCTDALGLLQPRLATVEQAAATVMPREMALMVWAQATEALLTAMYCEAVLGRPDAAVAWLARVRDPLDASLMQYQGAWYAALRALGAAEHPGLVGWLAGMPARPGVHLLSLQLARQQLTLDEALRRLRSMRLRPSEMQDGAAELLFFAGVAEKVAQGRTSRLAEMDALAPYGSAEWWVAAHLLAPATPN